MPTSPTHRYLTRHHGAWVTIALLSALAALLAGCNPAIGGSSDGSNGSDSGNGVPACDLRVTQLPTKVTNNVGRVVVEGAVTAICDVPPQSHHLTVWLDKVQANGAWEKKTASVQDYTTIPSTTGTEFFVVYIVCIVGRWRVNASVWGAGPDGKAFSFQLSDQELDAGAVEFKDCK